MALKAKEISVTLTNKYYPVMCDKYSMISSTPDGDIAKTDLASLLMNFLYEATQLLIIDFIIEKGETFKNTKTIFTINILDNIFKDVNRRVDSFIDNTSWIGLYFDVSKVKNEFISRSEAIRLKFLKG